MTEPGPGSEPSDESSRPTPLQYATPARTGVGLFSMMERRAIGCFGYLALSIAWFMAPGFLGYLGFRRGITVEESVIGWLLMTMVLLALSLFLRLRYGFRGYGCGILSVLGAGALIILGLFLLLCAICGSNSGTGHSRL